MPILPITDTDIDNVIKVAPAEVALDPNKTQGRNHRALIKLMRDYFAQELVKKMGITGPIYAGSNSGSALGFGGGWIGWNIKRDEATGIWTAFTDGGVPPHNAATILFMNIAGATAGSIFKIIEIPTAGDGSTNQTFTDAQIAVMTNVLTGYTLKADIETATTTGTVLTFAKDRVYGSETTPEISNITSDITGAKLGVTVLVIHNSGTAPSFDSRFHKLSGSWSYKTGVKNYIYCQYLSSTRIVYSINQ